MKKFNADRYDVGFELILKVIYLVTNEASLTFIPLLLFNLMQFE